MKHSQHGTTDHAGVFHPQLVNLGRTQSGKPGLFTGGMMAWPLTDSDYWALSSSRHTLREYAEARGFALAPQCECD